MNKDLKQQLDQLTALQRIAYQEGYLQGQKDKEKELEEKAEKEEAKLNSEDFPF